MRDHKVLLISVSLLTEAMNIFCEINDWKHETSPLWGLPGGLELCCITATSEIISVSVI